MSKVISYFTQVWEELGKVTWPTRQEATRMTLTVIIVSVIVAALIGGLDLFLTQLMSRIINL
ncbi:MAG: preprotein translocase subunit SecE [Candidatus Woykebacteria bacterium]